MAASSTTPNAARSDRLVRLTLGRCICMQFCGPGHAAADFANGALPKRRHARMKAVGGEAGFPWPAVTQRHGPSLLARAGWVVRHNLKPRPTSLLDPQTAAIRALQWLSSHFLSLQYDAASRHGLLGSLLRPARTRHIESGQPPHQPPPVAPLLVTRRLEPSPVPHPVPLLLISLSHLPFLIRHLVPSGDIHPPKECDQPHPRQRSHRDVNMWRPERMGSLTRFVIGQRA